jgi:hypothetical protein
MKKFISLLIGCSLALAGAAIAQQPSEESSPTKKKKQGAEQTQPAQAKPGATAAKPQQTARGAATERGGGKGRRARAGEETATAPGGGVSAQPSASPTGAKQQAEQQRKGKKGRAAKASPSPAATAAGAGATGTAEQKGQAATAGGGKKKLEQQQVQQIKTQHKSFRAQAKPQQVPAVTFNQNYRIQGSDRWQGAQYEVFRAYRPEWHDEGWYRAHYPRVELIGGGYYYFNNGYWYPAWGFNPSAQYYAYDGPIYVGHRAEPPDQVIADVQAELQQMGYYRGEVDGLLGPLTREALTAYQADNGLIQTAAVDEPTLDSLGLS